MVNNAVKRILDISLIYIKTFDIMLINRLTGQEDDFFSNFFLSTGNYIDVTPF